MSVQEFVDHMFDEMVLNLVQTNLFYCNSFIKKRIIDILELMNYKSALISNEYLFSIIIHATRGILKIVYSYDPENIINRI